MHELLMRMNDLFQSWGVHGLALNSFIESFFLVPPPDFLLITMDLAKPEKALFYATVCTVASLLGGMFGYALGYWGGRPVFNFIFRNKHEQFEGVERLYEKYGSLAVFFSAFTPIPYKIFMRFFYVLKGLFSTRNTDLPHLKHIFLLLLHPSRYKYRR